MRWSFGRFLCVFYTLFGFGDSTTNRRQFQNLRGILPSTHAHGGRMTLGGLSFSAGAWNIDNHVSDISVSIHVSCNFLILLIG